MPPPPSPRPAAVLPADALAQFAAAARRAAPVGDAAVQAVAALCTPRTADAGGWLLRGGERARWGFFVLTGLVRELYLDAQGEEHTRAFAAAGDFTGSLLDLLSAEPSVTWLQALEPTTLLAFPYAEFDALCSRDAELAQLARRVAERLYVRKARREHELLALPAAERHARWLREHAALDARISRRILASYLGITPVHLSRLRRAAAKQGGQQAE